MLKIFFDGATEPCNPGGAMGYGIVVKDEDGTTIHTNSWFVGLNPKNTNNVAEYLAFTEALKYVKGSGITARIYGDSQLVVKQMNGSWRIKEDGGAYTPYAKTAYRLLREVGDLVDRISWIPREENEEADEASKRSLVENGIRIEKRSNK
jgi:ribonuclease HI